MKVKDKIPTIYHTFFPDFIEKEIPEEKIATCNNCTLAMHQASNRINTKCCVYYAQIPNYLLGGLLIDNRASLKAGQDIARKLIKEKKGISPYGIRKPIWYKSLEKETKLNPKVKMTTAEQIVLRCPFYGKDGNCTTWAYREHCCSTFFCFSVGGDSGQTFWGGLDKFLRNVEKKLAQYAAQQLGCMQSLEKENLKNNTLNADDKNKKVNKKRYNQIWEGWNGNEVEFYIQAYKIIESLTQEEFYEIIDEKIANISMKVKDQISIFKQNIIPDNLVWNKNTKIVTVNKTKVKLITLSGSHEINLKKLPILQAFDGTKSLMFVAHLAFRANNNLAKDISKLIEINVLLTK